MKIIDFEKKGNVVRFYLGNNQLNEWYGDDWDDAPYEHNAGLVYDEFVEAHRDVVFPFDWTVLEPSESWAWNGNSPYCKDDMRNRKVPCIVAINDPEKTYDNFNIAAVNATSKRFYFGDTMEPSEKITVFDHE